MESHTQGWIFCWPWEMDLTEWTKGRGASDWRGRTWTEAQSGDECGGPLLTAVQSAWVCHHPSYSSTPPSPDAGMTLDNARGFWGPRSHLWEEGAEMAPDSCQIQRVHPQCPLLSRFTYHSPLTRLSPELQCQHVRYQYKLQPQNHLNRQEKGKGEPRLTLWEVTLHAWSTHSGLLVSTPTPPSWAQWALQLLMLRLDTPCFLSWTAFMICCWILILLFYIPISFYFPFWINENLVVFLSKKVYRSSLTYDGVTSW